METSEKTVAVTVTDEGDGKISVTAVPDQNAQEGNDFTFTNVYNVDPAESSLTGDGGFVLKKVLKANTDRVLGEGEFTFRLIDPADGSVAAETTNAADGTISMPAQNFTEPGDYTYLLKEAEGEFSFRLTDEEGNEIDTAKNEENGAVTFKTISFDKPGTYSYTISEVLPKDEDSRTEGVQSSNVTYDETIYHVTVEVKDNTETGCLEAGVNYEDSDGAPLFVNTYTEPKKEVPAGDDEEIIPGVETGDTVEIIPVLFAMVTAISVIIAMSAVMIRRRRK